jgi:hypothetical protein
VNARNNPSPEAKAARAIALYYSMSGKRDLSAVAGDHREEATAKSRKPFEIKNFRGVARDQVDRLRAVGIVDVDQMLRRGRTRDSREKLSQETGVPLPAILELVKMSDLSRLGAIKAVRARLYYDAGVDTPDKMASWEPQALRSMLLEFVQRTGFDGIAPLPKEIENAVATARSVTRLVEY